MTIVKTLNKKLLSQPFEDDPDQEMLLDNYKHIAFIYSIMENSLAVLSDFRAKKSYIYNGSVAFYLGLSEKGATEEIPSIWEEDIFVRIHPDDLISKHLLELQFFHFLKNLPATERSDYYLTSNIRMRNRLEEYVVMRHRMFYASGSDSMWLALCLYDFPGNRNLPDMYDGMIINSATGVIIKPDNGKNSDILSNREKEILRFIGKGMVSKEIAGILLISKNTVDRHRQNILVKLRVKNSIEAYRVAELMGVL